MADDTDAPKAPSITWPYEFPLTKNVKANDEEHSVLTLREPTGDDVLRFGLLDGLASGQFAPLVCRLAGVPEGTLKQMAAADLLRLATRLTRFFMEAAEG